MSRRASSAVLGLLVVALLSAGALLGCRAEPKYPAKPINVVVLVAAGGPMDVYARAAARLAEKVLKVPVSVENRTGGGGVVGLTYVQSQPADGYTVVGATGSVSYVMARPDSPVKVDQFEWVVRQIAEPASLMVKGGSEFKTLEDLVKYAKANPGKLKIGGSGTAGFMDFTFNKFSVAAGIQMAWVPFDGGAPAATALAGGHVDASWMTPSSGLGLLQEGRIRGLGVTSEKRLGYLSDVPTFKERGIDAVGLLWRGIVVKKGTPPEAVKILHDAFKQIMDTPDWKDYLEKSKQQEAYLGTADFGKAVATEIEEAAAYLRKIGVIK